MYGTLKAGTGWRNLTRSAFVSRLSFPNQVGRKGSEHPVFFAAGVAVAMKVLFVGDIVGRPGRDALKNHLGHILESRRIDLCIANAENSAAGNGITPRLGEELLGLKIDVLTSGNHIFDKREVLPYFEKEPRLLRPANYPPSAPGRGLFASQTGNGMPYAVINLQGRVFMPAIDCPFRTC